MIYPLFDELPALKAEGMISARPHPSLPLTIYNYSAKAQHIPLAEWTEAMMDCRGLILDDRGEIVARPFRKFWNYEQVLDQIPNESFEVFEKLDGSLGICASYAGELVCATRGSFESEQAQWFSAWMKRHRNFMPSGETWLFEIIYPGNRIVVDYGQRKEAVLLAVMSPDGCDIPSLFDSCDRFTKARRFDGVSDFAAINFDPRYAGSEGFVVRWESGFRAKVKLEEYKRLHRLITQCSTRTIWEMLRSGSSLQELLDRVPDEFAVWVHAQVTSMKTGHESLCSSSHDRFAEIRPLAELSRKVFAMAAKQFGHPALLFALLDGKSISDAAWKLVEPKWATPFRKDIDG